MKLTFLGTRGNIDVRSERHGRHSSLLVEYYGKSVMIDAGQDWLGKLSALDPDALVVTHAHPDHAWGLKDGVDCPVCATAEAWGAMEDYPIDERRVIQDRSPFELFGMRFEAFAVEHSTRAPAVGYRVQAGRRAVFYVPDVVYIHNRDEALSGVDLYIGDGATVQRSMVRKHGDHLVGHTPVRTQLTWCAKYNIPRALFTHCGTRVVTDEESASRRLREFAAERGVEAGFAYDGQEVALR